ncbi:MAG: hypothetical protein B9S34_00010 [Opitutia bacterium Tous-C1TDCM]|nr:MAG: hypothetical protein B9S34_00010 [Opitutae bacterium Tous-C1TDCM]
MRDAADGIADSRVSEGGDVVIFIHGYNNSPQVISERQKFLSEDLAAEGFSGVVISFDWPAANSTLNYLEDRSDAAAVAKLLVTYGIARLLRGQEEGCKTNVHLLGHSTGAYIICEALAQAEKDGVGEMGSKREPRIGAQPNSCGWRRASGRWCRPWSGGDRFRASPRWRRRWPRRWRGSFPAGRRRRRRGGR